MLKNLLKRFQAAPAAPAVPAAPAAPVAPLAASPAHATALARADTLVDEGNRVEDAGDVPRATALYREAVAAAPGHARAHLNLGIALMAADDADGASRSYETVLAIDPRHPFGNYNLARLVYLRGDLARAESLVAAALQAKPDFAQALVLQASVLDDLGRQGPAAEALRAALRLDPGSAGAWFNLGVLLAGLHQGDEAEDAALKARELEPGNPAVLSLLARALRLQGFADESLAVLQAFCAAVPEALPERSFELMMLNFVEGVGAEELFARHLAFGERLERENPVRFDRYQGLESPRPRMKVGYVSGDMRIHPVAQFALPVLECHDRAGFEVFVYSTGKDEDHVTRQARSAADHWREAAPWSDEALADAIHADGIDVLVDLTGHTNLSRLAVFCQRPAPVQATWLGYLNTTGLGRIDVRLSDARCDPVATSQPLHTERLVHLPHSQWCYRPFADVPVAHEAPLERNGYVTFGSFNAPLKISVGTCRRWAQLLARVPDSRLLVVSVPSIRRRADILREMAAAGIGAERISFAGRVPLARYLDLYNQVDVSLDPFPYGGGTTTFDSLWMGVPVIAAVGSTPVSRSAASVAAALGLEDWVAPSIDAYVDVGVARASDHAAIVALRRTLRSRLQASALTDVAGFTRDLEAAYRDMWARRTA